MSDQAQLFPAEHAALAGRSDGDLLSEACDAAAILSMGETGIGAATLAQLRRELVCCAAELGRRWGMA